VDQPGRGRSAYVPEVYGPPRFANAESAQQRYLQQSKYNLWPQAKLHNQWPGTGEIDYPTLFDLIDRVGYTGWIGCEYVPLAGTVEGLKWAKAYLA